LTPSTMDEHKVLVEKAEGVCVITINRPEARNAIDLDTSTAMCEAIDDLEASDSLMVGVITGAGDTFSSGMDLKAFAAGEVPDVPQRGMGGMTTTPPRKPLIAAVEGWALAGGLELMLACDLVIAGRSAKFGLPEVKRSLVPDGGGALRLPRRIPYAIAMELLLTGDPIDAERARAVGLINRVVENGEAKAGAVALARRIAANGPLAVPVVKEIAARRVAWDEAHAFWLQGHLSKPVEKSADAVEGAVAFAEKRPPRWRGE
jgi:enoyl-CoA hydratase